LDSYETQKQQSLSQNSYAAVISQNDSWGTLKRLTPDSLISESEDNFSLNNNQQIIFYTSGTVSPKACVLNLGNLFMNALGAQDAIPFHTGDIWGLCLPHFHVGAFSVFIRARNSAFVQFKEPEFR
jgi:acyl-CoA synthetase (AMP-forming)/AMP-acid ligase II